MNSFTAGGYVMLCWSWRDRTLSSYARNNAPDPWQLEGSYSLASVDGSLTYYGARYPSHFKIGIITGTWGSFTGTRYMGFRDFNLTFGSSSPLTQTDPAAAIFSHVVPGSGVPGAPAFAAISTPPYLPYGFSVAARDASGVLISSFMSPLPLVSGTSQPMAAALPLSPAALTGDGYTAHWDFSRVRGAPDATSTVTQIADVSGGRNPLVQTAAALRPRLLGGALGPWTAWAARGDSFLDAIPFTGWTSASNGAMASTASMLDINANSNWALFVVVRAIPAGSTAGTTADWINKGPSAGDT